MREQIESAFQPLLNQPLTDMWRYAGCQKFEFGGQRHRTHAEASFLSADWGLVVSCGWKISGPQGRIVASDDFGPRMTRRDEAAGALYELLHTPSAPRVTRIESDSAGRLSIEMTDGYVLEVCPEPCTHPNGEQWRLMRNDGEHEHCVLWGDGLGN